MSFLDSLIKIIGGYKDVILETADGLQKRVEQTTKQVIKSSLLFVLIVISLIFLLVGFAQWIEAYNNWSQGAGLMVVGGGVLLLVVIIKALK